MKTRSNEKKKAASQVWSPVSAILDNVCASPGCKPTVMVSSRHRAPSPFLEQTDLIRETNDIQTLLKISKQFQAHEKKEQKTKKLKRIEWQVCDSRIEIELRHHEL